MGTSRRRFLATGLGAIAYGAVRSAGAAEDRPTPAARRNVLFVAVDDLRPQLGCYGHTRMHTPNIDALAARGTLFAKAYCQQAVCNPSRASLMTGVRPDTTRVYDLQTHFRLHLPDAVTLPQHFRRHGYESRGFSKIYHGSLDDPQSWSRPHWRPRGPAYGSPETLAKLQAEREALRAKGRKRATTVLKADEKTGTRLKLTRPAFRVRGPSWEAPDVPDNALPDGKTTDEVIRVMRECKDRPFFLAAGFIKPHLPFVAPAKYFDLYPEAEITLADNPFPPEDCPSIALHNSGELRNYSDIPRKGPISEEKALELIRAYYAATSYIDAQVGRLLDELDRLGLREKTVVILWGDHGWQLGEHGLWCKHTNFETSAHVPLICSAPGQKRPGAVCDALTEFVDIYPSLCELCGLPVPGHLEGDSFAPLLDNPDQPWKTAAFSQYPRGSNMGYSIRTDRYRYTEWGVLGQTPVARELYDHSKDPNENVNLADRPAFADRVERRRRQLHAGWQQARPPG